MCLYNLIRILSSTIMEEVFDVPNWSMTQNDYQAQKKVSQLRKQACSALPTTYKSNKIITLFEEIRKTKLYSQLKSMPKGSLHHVHFDCCEDEDFYALHVITDPIVYLSQNLSSFHLGTKQQAQKNNWVSMNQAKLKFNNQQLFIKHVSNLTMLNKNQLQANLSETSEVSWKKFQAKICNFFPIFGALHLFKKYSIYVLKKLINNRYERVEFRSFLSTLKQYNENGQVVKEYEQKKFMEVFDEAFNSVKSQHPSFSVGFIFFGLKFFPAEENLKKLSYILQQRWEKTIGIDFVQEEDLFGSLQPYDKIADQILSKFADQNIKKVYHAGQTNDHLNRNIQISINAGSVRIGHGINILQHPHLIKICRQKKICFQKNPISNIVLGYIKDPRINSAQVLLSLGVPVSISSDDPAKFGLEDTTMDFFVAFVSSNWQLRHLKLLAIHSINHSICSEQTKKEMVEGFNVSWNAWVSKIISN